MSAFTHTRHVHDKTPGAGVRQIVHQRGLADTCLTPQNEYPALMRAHVGQHLVQRVALAAPTEQAGIPDHARTTPTPCLVKPTSREP